MGTVAMISGLARFATSRSALVPTSTTTTTPIVWETTAPSSPSGIISVALTWLSKPTRKRERKKVVRTELAIKSTIFYTTKFFCMKFHQYNKYFLHFRLNIILLWAQTKNDSETSQLLRAITKISPRPCSEATGDGCLGEVPMRPEGWGAPPASCQRDHPSDCLQHNGSVGKGHQFRRPMKARW